MLRGVHVLALACAILCFGACVTEVRPRAPVGKRSVSRAQSSAAPVALPDEQIAAPATAASVLNSRIRVALQPIGEIPFDGQTLPVLSPDGKFIATQVGPTPSWATVLGEEGAPLASTSIERYELTDAGPRLLGSVDAPAGTLLGHRASNGGFAVLILEGAAREEARVEWLHDVPQAVAPGGGPIAERFRLSEEGGLSLAMEGGVRRLLARNATALTRHQVIATLQDEAPLPAPDEVLKPEPPGLLFFHAGAERMAIYVFATTDIVLLEKNSIAGAWFVQGNRWGVFLTTPEGLQFQSLGVDSRGVIVAGSAARVLNEAYVPRSTSDPEHPYVLIGPGSSSDTLQLMRMTPVTE